MELVSRTSLRTAQLLWRPGHGGFAFTVVCKATFALRPDLSPLAPSQEPVVEADVLADGGGSLALATDLVPLKKRPEVILVGQAFAPGGKRAPSFVARLVVGELDKALQIAGNRGWGADGQLGEPAPFTRMPLVWERAAGGPGTVNPVGRSSARGAAIDAEGRVPAPNLLPVGYQLAARGDLVPSVGFGPVAPFWPSRAACLHRHAATWDAARWHERALPQDIDLAYFNAAPADQQRVQPFGEERIHMENLHPLFARLSTRLAPAAPVVTVDRGQGAEPLQMRCDTLVINTDRGFAMLVWRGLVLLDRLDQPGRIVVSDLAAEPGGRGKAVAPGAVVLDQTRAQEFGEQAASTLPFGESRGEVGTDSGRDVEAGAHGRGPAPAHAENSLSSGATVAVDALFGGTMAFGFANAAPALPFPAVRGEGAARAESPPGTAEGQGGLPFVPAGAVGSVGPVVETPVMTPGVVAAVVASDSLAPATPDSPWVRPSAAFDRVKPATDWHSLEPGLPSSAPSENPLPPAMVGGRATGGGAEAPVPATGDGDLAEVDVEAYPPVRCGALAARIACDPGAVADILRAEGLDAAAWKRVHEHWQARIEAEASRGRPKLLTDYDGAYVTAVEAERIPITLDIYARLAEAQERGAIRGALSEMRFPEDAWLHIHRSWIPRLVKDLKLAKQVRAAIAEIRNAAA